MAVVRSAGVERLVDVRRHPGSRRNPHLSRQALAVALPALGLVYEWRGEELGGRRAPARPTRHPEWADAGFRGFADYMDAPEFQAALHRLTADAAQGPPLAVMCAETLWWRCHRRLIAEAAVAAGTEVIHILGSGQTQAHPAGLV